MYLLTMLVNAVVALSIGTLLWIGCQNSGHTPDSLNVIVGVVLIAIPGVAFSAVAFVTRKHRWLALVTLCASIFVGGLAVWILGTNTPFARIPPGDLYENPAPPIVLFGQTVLTAICTTLILLRYGFAGMYSQKR